MGVGGDAGVEAVSINLEMLLDCFSTVWDKVSQGAWGWTLAGQASMDRDLSGPLLGFSPAIPSPKQADSLTSQLPPEIIFRPLYYWLST